MLEKDRLLLIYAGIVSFQFHPRVERRMTAGECMVVALAYLREYESVSEDLWPGLDQ